MNKFHPLQEWLDILPEPITFYEKLICWWSNFVDNISILKWKVKMQVKRGKDYLWRPIKFKGDGAIYAKCKCGFYYPCCKGPDANFKIEIDPNKMYPYCPACGARKKRYLTEVERLDRTQWE